MKKVNEILQELLTKLDAEMFYSIAYSGYRIALQGNVKKSSIDKLAELGYELKFDEKDYYFIYKANIENGIELDITLTIR
jgi:hypothetical protein